MRRGLWAILLSLLLVGALIVAPVRVPVAQAATAGSVPGDMNGDGRVSNEDVIYLLWHTLFGGEEYPVSNHADFVGNGQVDNADVIYLLWHTLFGEEEYPLIAYSEGLEFCAYEDGYMVLGMGTCTDTDLVIPAVYQGKPVVSIGWGAFALCDTITSVTILNPATVIESYAFDGCTALSEVSVPETLSNVGDAAFNDTAWYAAQPDGVVYVGAAAYRYKGECNGTVTIQTGTLRISDYAFFDCEGLRKIVIPNGVTNIGMSAFYGCTNLSQVSIPDSVVAVEWGAFEDTAWLEAQPDGVVYAGKVAYQYKGACPEHVTLRAGTVGIADEAFYGCKNLVQMDVPRGVVAIGYNAFAGCVNLAQIDIPATVSSIGGYAFEGCRGLKKITIPEGVTKLASTLFWGCKGLEEIVLPDSLTYIDNWALGGCTSLTTVTIPGNVTTIGHGAFEGCTSLKTVTIPVSVTTIYSGSFYQCDNLKTVYYEGTADQWAKVYIDTDNEDLTEAQIYFGGDTTAANQISKIALITDGGSIDDRSFNQICWQGVEDWATANGVAYTYYQPYDYYNDALVAAVVQAVAEGADTIVMPGFVFGATLTVVMDMYPDVNFIAVDVAAGDLTVDYSTYYDPTPNVACLTFAEEQAGYLAGYAAVKDGYTKLGFLGGMAVPAVVRYGYGFVQGANAAAVELGKEIEINYTYGNQFYGSPEITSKMKDWYKAGTEVVFACGGGIYTSVLEAAERYDAKVIGVDVDQAYIDGDFVTSAIKQLQNATENVLEALNKGKFSTYGGKVTNLSLADGDFVGLPTAESSWKFTTFTVEEYEALKAAIASGAVTVSADTEKTPAVAKTTTVNYID